MASFLFGPLLRAGALYAITAVFAGGSNVKYRTRQLAKGAGLVALAISIFFLTFISLAVSLFFYLAGFAELVQPALITTLIIFLIGSLFAYRGWLQFKR